MAVYKKIEKFLGDLYELAQGFNYPASSLCALTGKEVALQEMYPETYSNLVSCSHHGDHRTPIEYGQDLVASWIFEDCLMRELSSAGLQIEKAGADKHREILPSSEVSTTSDFIVFNQGRSRGLEVMCDYTGYWRKKHLVDLRDDKYDKIVETGSIFLGIATSDRLQIISDDITVFPSVRIPRHWKWEKPVQQFKISADNLDHLDYNIIVDQIKKMITK